MFYAMDTRTRTNEMSAEYTYFYILSPFVRLCAYTIIYNITYKCTLLHVHTFAYDVFSPPPVTHSPRRRPPPRPCTIFVVVETTVAAEWSARASARPLVRPTINHHRGRRDQRNRNQRSTIYARTGIYL